MGSSNENESGLGGQLSLGIPPEYPEQQQGEQPGESFDEGSVVDSVLADFHQ